MNFEHITVEEVIKIIDLRKTLLQRLQIEDEEGGPGHRNRTSRIAELTHIRHKILTTAQENARDKASGLYLLEIHHRHGTDLFVHRTNEGAANQLIEYVRDNWDKRTEGEYWKETAIDKYFESREDEHFDINIMTVRD